jgi:flagellar hook-length control protein FliK
VGGCAFRDRRHIAEEFELLPVIPPSATGSAPASPRAAAPGQGTAAATPGQGVLAPDVGRSGVSAPLQGIAALARVQVGALIAARVERGAPAGGMALLRIGAGSVEALTARRLDAGTQLNLQVLKAAPVVELRVLPTRGSVAQEPLAAQGLRQALPRQQPLGQVLASLTGLSRDGLAGGAAETAAVQRIAAQVRALTGAALDPRVDMAPVLLRQAVQESGTFLESRLAAAAASLRRSDPSADLKAGLLRLREGLATLPARGAAASGRGAASAPGPGSSATSAAASAVAPPVSTTTATATAPSQPPGPTPGLQAAVNARPEAAPGATGETALARVVEGLRQGVEAGIARIEMNQILSARGGQDSATVAYLDLPLRSGEQTDDARLALRRERRGAGAEAEHVWTATLEVTPPGLGPLAIQVAFGGGQVSSTLVAERGEARERLQQALPRLQELLQGAGLSVSRLSARQGAVTDLQRPPAQPPELVSVRA